QIGLICSEKQAIDATLDSLALEDPRFGTVADRYWNARGGSSTDGGAFIFTVDPKGNGNALTCTDKFGAVIEVQKEREPYDFRKGVGSCALDKAIQRQIEQLVTKGDARRLFAFLTDEFILWDYEKVRLALDYLLTLAGPDQQKGM